MSAALKYAHKIRWLVPVVGGAIGAGWYSRKSHHIPPAQESNCRVKVEVIQPKVIKAEPEPIVIETEPAALVAKPDPVIIKAEPEPIVIETEPAAVVAKPDPVIVKAEPIVIETAPAALVAKPDKVPPVVIETEPAVGANQVVGDTVMGERLFKSRCSQCHTTEEGGINKQGPNLFGIIGRTAGSVPGFNYSPANKNSGIIWQDQTLFDYLLNPKKYIPKTKMAFPGLKKPQDRWDLIAYLREQS